MSDYDAVRDQALLFFLDHLLGKKGPAKTLHDLSCQFGAKGFTKEMRQVAGGSLSGLRKFLEQFPSLFTIEGDNVFLTPIVSEKDEELRHNYTQETIDFFITKLGAYGNAEVPLKSLFGHRSQASSKIRHISGQNVREFRDFLASHADVFVIRDDYVVLRDVLDEYEKDGQLDGDQPRRTLKRMPEEMSFDPILMKQLVDDLEARLLQLGDTVTVELLFGNIASASQDNNKFECIKAPSDLLVFLHMNSHNFLVQGNTVSLSSDRLEQLKKRSQSGSLKHQIQASPTHSSQVWQHESSKSTSLFNKNIRSQILKVVTNNIQHDLAKSNGAAAAASSTSQSIKNGDGCDLQSIKPRIIVSSSECQEVMHNVLEQCSQLAFDVEGIGMGESSGEITLVQLAPIRSDLHAENEIYIFDVLLNPNLIQLGVRQLLQSQQIIKVGHNVGNHSAALHRNYNITLANVFDTQIAHLVIQQQDTGKPAFKPSKYVSLQTICQMYDGPQLNPKLKDRLHKIYKKDHKYWQRRPLTSEMLQFAVSQVHAISGVYSNMSTKIKSDFEPLLRQLVFESIFACINTDEIKHIRKQRKFELELQDLKRKLLHSQRKQIVLSNREIRLLRYIELTDEIRNKIEGQQNVIKKLKRYDNSKKTSNADEENGNSCGSNESEENHNNQAGDEEEEEEGECEIDESIDSVDHETTIGKVEGREVGTQTLSTGDIVFTKLFFEDSEPSAFT